MKNKKITYAIIVVLIVAIIVITIYKIIDIQKEKQEDAVALTLKENLTTEFLSDVKVSDFIENLQGELIDDEAIETNTLGEKEVTFRYKSIRNKNKTKSFIINIIDTEKPLIYMGSTMTLVKGYNKNIADTVLSGDNADPNPERIIEGDYDLNTAGTYNLKFIVRDSSGNEESKDFTLKIVESTSRGGTTNVSPQNIKTFSDCISTYKNENTQLGIDVSKWQGDIDWNAVKKAGAEFAFIRIGYQNGFDGEYKEDEYFTKNIEGATSAGLKVGGYFYSYAKTEEEALLQADWVIEKISKYDVTLPIAFDWESWTSFATCSMSFYDLNHIAQTYIKKLEDNGYKGSLYSSKTYLQKIWYTEKFENTWLAHYTNKTDYEGNYFCWQMCDTGRIDGISGTVDIDILKVNI